MDDFNSLFLIILITILYIGVGTVLAGFLNPASGFILFILLVSLISYYKGSRDAVITWLFLSAGVFLIPVFYTLTLAQFIGRYLFTLFVSGIIIFIHHRLKYYETGAIQAQSRLKIVSDSITDTIVTVDSKGIITFCNPSTEKMFGYKDLIGKPVFILLSEKYKKKHSEGFVNYVTNKEKSVNWEGFEAVGLRANGEEFPIEVSFGEFQEDNKLFFSAVIRDITSRKQFEQTLQEAEERYKAFLSNSKECIWRIEFDSPCPTNLSNTEQIDWIYDKGYIAECNNATARMYNFDSAMDVIGKSVSAILPRNDRNITYLKVFIKKDYYIENIESHEKLPDGTDFYLINNLYGVVKDGKLLRCWGVQRDITREKIYNLEKEKLLEEARKAQELAELAGYEKDRFLANLSHELRTPLVSILGYSTMLLEDSSIEEQEKVDMLKVIYKNAKMQVDLIEDLLDLSRIISNKVELKKSFFNVKEVLDHVIAMFQPQVSAKELDIYKEYTDLVFYADEKRFQQIATNLMSNAVKFTDTGFIKISVTKTEDTLTFSVKDSGIGISEDNLPKLFKEFGQIDKSSTRSKGGLGLGLSIVKNLVDLHKGNINVRSVLGCGSKFTVSFPVDKEPESFTEMEIKKDISFQGLRILLTEDEVDSAEFIKFFYIRLGAKVDWAESAKSAREFIAVKDYDIYLFDLAMPEEDGISLIKSLRAKGDKTPAVAITAFVDTYYKDIALKAGFNRFIKKPSAFSDLLAITELIN